MTLWHTYGLWIVWFAVIGGFIQHIFQCYTSLIIMTFGTNRVEFNEFEYIWSISINNKICKNRPIYFEFIISKIMIVWKSIFHSINWKIILPKLNSDLTIHNWNSFIKQNSYKTNISCTIWQANDACIAYRKKKIDTASSPCHCEPHESMLFHSQTHVSPHPHARHVCQCQKSTCCCATRRNSNTAATTTAPTLALCLHMHEWNHSMEEYPCSMYP